MSESVIVYKEVGKDPQFMKVQNSMEEFEKLVGGEIAFREYDDYVIVYRKDNERLRANIYIAGSISNICFSIRGTVFAINRSEKGEFSTLTKEQAIKCRNLFIQEAFHYDIFDEKGRYIRNKKKNKRQHQNEENSTPKNMEQGGLVLERDSTESPSPPSSPSDTDQTLELILRIQSAILQFIKKSSN